MFKVGYARLDITPPLGARIDGYYKDRFVEGVLDPLDICCIVLECNGMKAMIAAVDCCALGTNESVDAYRKHISEKTGIAIEAIYLAATHTHTGADLRGNEELTNKYREWVDMRLTEVATLAVADLKEAKMGWGIGNAPNISFIRRFRMKDGSVQTNPGVNNPDIVAPIGDIDDSVNVIRFDRENADTIVLINFADHPDVVGGSLVSADWPGFARRQFEQAVPGTKTLLLNGAQGDINHVNVHPKGGDFNDMFNDFDAVARGYGHARYMGRVVCGGVFQAYDKVEYCDVDEIKAVTRIAKVPSNMGTPEELKKAHEYEALHRAGRDDEIPFKAMMLTTVVAEAERMINLENGPEYFDLAITGLKIGPLAFVGFPGEPFNGIGVGIKESKAFDNILITCLTNGDSGYFPMKDAYDEGGYESASSPFKAGVAEILIEEGTKLLEDLK